MRYIVKRVGMAVVTLFSSATIAFVLFRMMPGNPVDAFKAYLVQQRLRGPGGSAEIDIQQLNRQVEVYMNVDPEKSILQAYFDYVSDIVLRQDFGESYFLNEPVFDILFRAMPWTVFISVYGLLLGFTTSIFLGALMAYWEGTKFDYGLTVFGMVIGSVPYYVGAIVMLAYLGFEYGIFPTGGRVNTAYQPGFNPDYMLSIVKHAALPILTGFIAGFGGDLSMRANSIRILGSDYLRSANLRGIGISRTTTRYVIRNAILPNYTGLMIGISGIFSANLIMEQIFQYKGVGLVMFGALLKRDYSLLMGSFLFYTTLTIIGILIADLTYGIVDPRIRSGGERESF